ncbi:ESPR domain-containing protein, partial [Stenotrophomonas sp. AB1(2024)]|uniref:ESPR domain-containing protein n=1 Tax=Stenotrophomonas sp. AB1(2024) TaxID=3132215 RepID=UPI0030AADC14
MKSRLSNANQSKKSEEDFTMNRIFTKIWSVKLGQFVVASEHARLSGGKRARTTIRAIGGVALALMTLQIMPMALAQNSGLQLCNPDGTGTPNSGKSLGSGSTAPVALTCGDQDYSFSLNNRGEADGSMGFSAATARVTGYYNGMLELKADSGISVLGNMQLNNNTISGLNAGLLSSTSTEAVNGSQLFTTNE